MKMLIMVWPDIWSYRPPKGLIFQTISEGRMQEKITTDDSGAGALDASVSTYRASLNAPGSEPIDTGGGRLLTGDVWTDLLVIPSPARYPSHVV